MCNCFGVVVLHRSFADERREMGQSAMARCTFCYSLNIIGVVVFQRSILNWKRGLGQAAMMT